MAEVTISVGGRSYAMHCGDGEEAHLLRLARAVDAKIAGLRGAGTGLTEVRQLLYAAIFLADDLHDARAAAAPTELALDSEDDQTARALEQLAIRLETLAERLAPVDPAS